MGDLPGLCTPEVWMKRGDRHWSCLAPGAPSLSALALWISFPWPVFFIAFSISCQTGLLQSRSFLWPPLNCSLQPCLSPRWEASQCQGGSFPMERGWAAMSLAPRVHFISGSPPRGRAWQPLLLLGKQTAGLGNVGFSNLRSGSLRSWMPWDLQSARRDNSE